MCHRLSQNPRIFSRRKVRRRVGSQQKFLCRIRQITENNDNDSGLQWNHRGPDVPPTSTDYPARPQGGPLFFPVVCRDSCTCYDSPKNSIGRQFHSCRTIEGDM